MKNATQKVAKKSGRLEIRITEANKKHLEERANSFGITMAEIITGFIDGSPVVDKKTKNEKFQAIHTLCKEINYIGKNINQITIAIRQINSGKKIEDGEFKILAQELKKYNEKQDEISELLGKNLF